MLSGSEIAPPALDRPQKGGRGLRPSARDDGESKEGYSTLGADMEKANRLFDIMSAKSDIDHPICVECTQQLVEGLEKKLEASARERDAYVAFLKRLQNDAPTEVEVEASRQELAAAQKKQEEAMKVLKDLEDEKRRLDQEMIDLGDDLAASQQEVAEFCIEDNLYSLKLNSALSKQTSIQSALKHDETQLSLLQRTNIHNDLFSISHDGIFGTINSLRLGRLSTHPVDWPEINAAWGHALLLLCTVARETGYKFKNYEPAPMGSTSAIYQTHDPTTCERLSKRKKLDLWTSGDLPLGLMFMHRRFDSAMVAFLDLVKQLADFVEADGRRLPSIGSRESSPRTGGRKVITMPYKIEGDKIGGESIRLGGFQDDGWSTACKYVLTCCKYLLAHVSNAGQGLRRRE